MRMRFVVLCLLLLAHARAHAQVCTEVEHTFLESFDDQLYEDPASSVDRWGDGEIVLSAKGNTFEVESDSVGEKVYVASAGDFDGDGWVDMVALMLEPSCHIHFLRNQGMSGSPAEFQGFDIGGTSDSRTFKRHTIDSPPGCSTEAPVLLSGDYDGDGDTDVLYLRVNDEGGAGAIEYAYMYECTGVDAGIPQFTRSDVLADLDDDGLAWHWTSMIAQSVDWDDDDHDDLVIASSHDRTNELLLFKGKTRGVIGFRPSVTLIPDLGMSTPIASSRRNASGGSSCPPAVSRGVNSVMVGDFDADQDFDVIVGSTSEEDLRHWENDGSDVFTRRSDISFPEGAATLGLVGDYDSDGDLDVIVGRDGWNCHGVGGNVWLYANDGSGNFVQRRSRLLNAGDDLDFGVTANFDNDSDGMLDFIVADGNHSGAYSQVLRTETDVFSLEGTALSTAIDSLDNAKDAVVSVKITGLTEVEPAGTDIEYFLSNDDGDHWEPVLANELPPTSDTHTFTRYGSDFRWKAVLSSEEQTLTGDEAAFGPATKATPCLQDISFSYTSVDRQIYTRSGLAFGEIEVKPGENHPILFHASYYYPGFEATVRAYDLSNLAMSAAGTGLRRVDNHGDVKVLWKAGELLAGRRHDSRTVYAAYARQGDGDNVVNDRLDFTVANLNSTTPTLQSMMVVDEATKKAVVRWTLGGLGAGGERPWKLFDVGHSSPVFVGAPTGDTTYYPDAYDAFATSRATRNPTIYIGANDGMLHAFDAKTGEERWGLIPNNLLAKLKRQRVVDAYGEETYEHDYYVDGSVVVEDVHDGTDWHTVAFVAQAQGQGRADNNYYFAIDVTNPAHPSPLWEFTDPAEPYESCSGKRCTTTCVPDCDAEVCSNDCTAADHIFEQHRGDVVIEAENYNSKTQVAWPHDWTEETSASGYSGSGYMTALPNRGTDCSRRVESCGAKMNYNVILHEAGSYYVHFRVNAGSRGDDSVNWGFNGVHLEELGTNTDRNVWDWDTSEKTVRLGPGEHTLHIWMGEDGLKLDKILVSTTRRPPRNSGPAEACAEVCDSPVCRQEICTEQCIPAGEEWPECGVGDNQECCGTPGSAHCATVGTCASSAPDAALGETWSPPVAARVRVDGKATWVVFFGSGYNNLDEANVGRSLYALNAMTGRLLGRWDVDDIATDSNKNSATIENTIPAGPNVVDIDNDKYIDRVYFGDLEGRLWRLDVSIDATISGTPALIDNWTLTNIFDAGLANGSGSRDWAPIITKPAIAVIDPAAPNIYFGTGGDDSAPGDATYFFFSIRDTVDTTRYPDEIPTVPTNDANSQLEWKVAGAAEHKFWSDPTLVNNTVVYFASLSGSIESVDPCEDLGDASYVYGYATQNFSDGTHTHQAGKTVFVDTTNGRVEQYAAGAKVRRAVTVGRVDATSPPRPSDASTQVDRTPVYIQEFTGEIKDIVNEGYVPSSWRLEILHWREVPL